MKHTGRSEDNSVMIGGQDQNHNDGGSLAADLWSHKSIEAVPHLGIVTLLPIPYPSCQDVINGQAHLKATYILKKF